MAEVIIIELEAEVFFPRTETKTSVGEFRNLLMTQSPSQFGPISFEILPSRRLVFKNEFLRNPSS